ncbi:hypothetical protein WJU23_19210 [Prosthecobacter sp. SYSU 5D2]|uniref:hypothetical protein n=1 Tax=Prosthecobacter sp. SYSU 5D2 TaxID=3134134 RepID=UPI0031FE7D50
MTRTYPLELPFRGERTYLHGTDLHQAIVAALGADLPAGPVSITFHSLLKQLPDLVCSTDSLRHLRDDPTFRGEVRFGSGDAVLNAALLESTRPATERKICNENEVAAAAVVDETAKSATLEADGPGNLIERIVFLNKHLHLKLLPHLSPKWLFARLELSAPLPAEAPQQLSLVLKQVLGNRFTRSDILFDGQRFGSISFSTPQ